MKSTDKIPPKQGQGQKKPKVQTKKKVKLSEEHQPPEGMLQTSEEKFRRLFETAQDGILLLDAGTGVITEANPFIEALLGYSHTEIIGKKLWEIGPMKDIAASQDAFLELQKKNYIRYDDLPLETKDGRRRKVEFVSNVYQVGSQKVIQCNIRDITERRLAENALAESEKRYRVVFDNAGLGVFQSEVSGRIIAVNPKFAHLFGYRSPEEFVALVKDAADVFADPQRRAEILRLKADNPEVMTFENLYRRKDGSTFLGNLTVEQVTGPDGRVLFLQGLIEDITERKRAEEELRNSEKRFRKVFDDGPHGMAISNTQYHFVRANASFCQMMGYTEQELQSLTFKDITHPEDAGDSIKNVQELEKGILSVYKTEKRYITKNKEIIWGSLTLSMIIGGEKQFFLVMIEDITERKKMEDALRLSEDKFSKAFQNSPDSVNINRLVDGMYIEINRGFTVLTGYTVEEVVGKSSLEINIWANPDDRARLVKELHEHGGMANLEAPFRTKDGTVKTCLMSAAVLIVNGEQCILSITRDITERKQAEETLRASELRYRGLFEDSPIPLWEEDFSAVKRQIEKMKQQGVTDFRDFFGRHAEEVIENVKKIKVIDVNKAAVALMRAVDKEQLVKGLKQIMHGSGEDFVDEFVSIAEGKTEFEWEGINHTLEGEELTVSLRWSAAPGYEDSLGKVLVSMVDVTERKRVEKALALRTEELRQRNDELTRINEQAEHRMQRLMSMRTIDMAISGSFDVGVVLGIVLDQVTSQLGSQAADILLFSQGGQTFKFSCGRGFRNQGLEHSHYKFGSDIAWRIIRERRKVEISDLKAQVNALQRTPNLSDEDFLSYIGVPLVSKGQVRGVLEIFLRERLTLDQEWYNYLEMLAGQAAIAIDNADLFEHMQSTNTELVMAYDSTLTSWANALEMRALEPKDHTRRVDNLTTRLAQGMGLSGNDLVNAHRGAMLHDIGKMGLPDSILLKPGPLTEEEWELMRKHPQIAFEMLSPISYLRPALDIPYYHHEKWDGTGYPRGLKGENIPLAARIFAVVDVWDALTSDRLYRKAWSEAEALEYIREQAGHHFDPLVAKNFLELSIGKRNEA